MARGSILVTGAAGYIGSHTTVELLQAGFRVIGVDNLSNSSPEALNRVRELVPGGELAFHQVDLLDTDGLRRAFTEGPVDAVIHFAGLKAVGESVGDPRRYYRNNLAGTINLLDMMRERGVTDLVFSSSCTVYGEPERLPITEDCRLEAASPYGRTKLMIEEMLVDVAAAEPEWRIVALRYFNPVGAHESGRIGEDPTGVPNNLMPFIMQVAVGQRDQVTVFGDDYDTPDGTCVRDYIHVVDLAAGHLAALDALDEIEGCRAVNLGTGVGSSVLDALRAAEAAVGRPIPYVLGPRRPGDIAAAWADAALAAELLKWRSSRTLADACVDHWRWQSTNPRGYAGDEA